MSSEGNRNNIRQKSMKESEWIEQVLDSTRGLHHSKPSSDLWSKIDSSLPQARYVNMFENYWKIAAACVAILFVVNVWLIFGSFSNSSLSQVESQSDHVYGNYSLNSNFQLYQE